VRRGGIKPVPGVLFLVDGNVMILFMEVGFQQAFIPHA
jgi:hypothetical protein